MSILRWNNPYYTEGNPYNWRTWLRGILPNPISQWISKGHDCEKLGAKHYWYNIDNVNNGCYHCDVVKKGNLWKK